MSAVQYLPLDQSNIGNRKDYNGLDKVPSGSQYHPIVSSSKINGKYQVVGYITSDSSVVGKYHGSYLSTPAAGKATVFFENAPASLVSSMAKTNGLTKTGQTDATTGGVLYRATPKATAAGAPTTVADGPIKGGAATDAQTSAGGYQPGIGATTATGSLNAQTALSNSGSDVDTSKLKVNIKGAYAPEGGDFAAALGIYAPPQQATIQDRVNKVFDMTPDGRASLTKRLASAGYGPNDSTLYGLAKAYEGALIDLNRLEQAPGGANSNLTIDDFLKQQAVANTAGATSKTITSTQAKIDTPQDAEGILAAEFKTALGRKPTPQELGAFTSALQAYEKANPTVTNTTGTTSTLNGQTAGNTSSTVTGGTSGAGINQYTSDYVDQHFGTEKAGDSIGSAFNLFLSTIGAGAGAGSNPGPA